jgi:hypothetical protein
MMKKTWMVFGLMFLLIGTACEKEDLETNEVYRSKDLKIEFKDYTDSRCPIGDVCIWEGEAEVYLEAKSNGQSESFFLNGLGDDTTIFGHSIELIDLQPYPQSGVEIEFKDKEVKLKVTKI